MFLSNYRLIDTIMEKYEILGFNKAQIRELRRGIEADIDISEYDDINKSAEEMFKMRWKLIQQNRKVLK